MRYEVVVLSAVSYPALLAAKGFLWHKPTENAIRRPFRLIRSGIPVDLAHRIGYKRV